MVNRRLLLCGALAIMAASIRAAKPAQTDESLVGVNYITSTPLRLNMDTENNIKVELVFNKDHIIKYGLDNFTVTFRSKTFSPQFSILQLDEGDTSRISVSRRQLESSRFVYSSSLRLRPTYIGHAVIAPDNLEFTFPRSDIISGTILGFPSMQLQISVVKSSEGEIWATMFVVSVLILMIISYINLGAQLDVENLKEIIKKPQALILGFMVSVLVMPIVSWLVGLWLLRDQLLYRVGSFIFACCPAASASTLWTVMFNSDKELSIGLQAFSTVGSLVTMPSLLYLMDRALQLEGSKHTVQVPYARLIQTQFVLIVALVIGWYFVGRHERSKKISSKIFKPLTFFILIFIIIFSTIVYWYIYRMFDWNITLTSLLISLVTYGLSSLLGFLASFNLDRAIAISISSTYKNSGIAFAVLLLAFESPDTYINYVPCLTQVLTTSVTLYLIYSVFALLNYIKRRNQPDPIQATTSAVDDSSSSKKRGSRSGSAGNQKSIEEQNEEENDEFIAMNVTDVVPGSPGAQQ